MALGDLNSNSRFLVIGSEPNASLPCFPIYKMSMIKSGHTLQGHCKDQMRYYIWKYFVYWILLYEWKVLSLLIYTQQIKRNPEMITYKILHEQWSVSASWQFTVKAVFYSAVSKEKRKGWHFQYCFYKKFQFHFIMPM